MLDTYVVSILSKLCLSYLSPFMIRSLQWTMSQQSRFMAALPFMLEVLRMRFSSSSSSHTEDHRTMYRYCTVGAHSWETKEIFLCLRLLSSSS